jgi:hypothetical protein
VEEMMTPGDDAIRCSLKNERNAAEAIASQTAQLQ